MEGGEKDVTASNWKKSVDTLSILVVADDPICLSVVAAILKKFKYEVVTVNHPKDALFTLRIRGGAFDLVVSDVHMPDMNGFELQQTIAQEFDLPVILMSADDKEGIALRGLDSGAVYFIGKPVCPDDLKDIWQFAAMKKRSSQVVIEETHQSLPMSKRNTSDDIVSSTSENDNIANKDFKRKSSQKEASEEEKGENSQSPSHKKPKVVWSNSLHNRFLEAIRSIGLDRAVPKKILEVMNVPGLTRENVASHLQKYRMFLRRVSDASYKIQLSSDKGLRRILKSSGESSGNAKPTSTPTLNNTLNNHIPEDSLLPNRETSTTLTPQFGFGQTRLLSNNIGSWIKPNIINPQTMITNDLHINEVPHSRSMQNNYPAGLVWACPSSASSNYVGYNISNITHLTKSLGSDMNIYKGFRSSGGMISYPVDEPLRSSSVLHTQTMLPTVNLAMGASTSDNNVAQYLSDINVADYRTLMPSSSNLPPLDSGTEIQESAFSPILDLSEFDVVSTQQTLEEGRFGATFGDHINVQNQLQQTRSETTTYSNFYGDFSHWENHVPSFDEVSNQLIGHNQGLMSSHGFSTTFNLNGSVGLGISQTQEEEAIEALTNPPRVVTSRMSKSQPSHTQSERDDADDFLESLLAPYEEDQTLEGI